MDRSEDIKDLAAALAKAQAEIEPAEKDSENPHFRNRYASLAAVIRACRAPLAKHGLAVTQTTEEEEGGRLYLRTTLWHESGQSLSSRLPMTVAGQKSDMQALGSALTYARRYGWSAMVGVCADDDDDGEGAAQAQRQAAQPRQPAARPAAPPNGNHAPESSGDRKATQQPSQQQSAPAGNPNTCGECGKALTASQVAMSRQKFGRPLCPEHQKSGGEPAAAPKAEAPVNGTGEAQPDERRQKQKAWHAQLREHCGDLTDEERHAFTAALLDRPDITSEASWQVRAYEIALKALNAHVADCPGVQAGGKCPLSFADPFADADPGSVPAAEGAAA